MLKPTYVVAASVSALAYLSPVYAEELQPKATEVTFEHKHDQSADQCSIVVVGLNLPEPEILKLRYSVTANADRTQLFTGIEVDVGDIEFVNGLPGKLHPGKVASAEFETPDFSSLGRMNPVYFPDGGFMATTNNPEVEARLTIAFLTGDYNITFMRGGSSHVRTYHFAAPVPKDVNAKMMQCLRSAMNG